MLEYEYSEDQEENAKVRHALDNSLHYNCARQGQMSKKECTKTPIVTVELAKRSDGKVVRNVTENKEVKEDDDELRQKVQEAVDFRNKKTTNESMNTNKK